MKVDALCGKVSVIHRGLWASAFCLGAIGMFDLGVARASPEPQLLFVASQILGC